MHVRRRLNELKPAKKKSVLIKEGYVARLLNHKLTATPCTSRSSFLQVFDIQQDATQRGH
jgi:hypothetical protein